MPAGDAMAAGDRGTAGRCRVQALRVVMGIADVPLADTLARPLRSLRISVTDRCQFRCTYCMPRRCSAGTSCSCPAGSCSPSRS
jgi:hypothetical protein